jgi:hypothetical protein
MEQEIKDEKVLTCLINFNQNFQVLFVPGNVFLHDIVQNNRGYKVAHHTVDSKMKSVYV